jgi:hypothetical protein
MKIQIEINEADLRRLVADKIGETMGAPISPDDILIEVKSKQNYRAEWEKAEFRARVDKVSA